MNTITNTIVGNNNIRWDQYSDDSLKHISSQTEKLLESYISSCSALFNKSYWIFGYCITMLSLIINNLIANPHTNKDLVFYYTAIIALAVCISRVIFNTLPYKLRQPGLVTELLLMPHYEALEPEEQIRKYLISHINGTEKSIKEVKESHSKLNRRINHSILFFIVGLIIILIEYAIIYHR